MSDLKKLRTSRNLAHSIKEFMESKLEYYNWPEVSVIFRNQRTDQLSLPYIAIKIGSTIHNRVEFSSSSTYRNFAIILDLFCESDIQRDDLKDTIISFVKSSFPYNQYEMHTGDDVNALIISSHNKGQVRVISLDDEEIDLNVPKSQLSDVDRYRHRITLNCMLGIVEAEGDTSV